MNSITILIFENKILFDSLKQLQLFSEYDIKFYNNFDLCLKEAHNNNCLLIFYVTKSNKKIFDNIKKNTFPTIGIFEFPFKKNNINEASIETANIPVDVITLKKKIVLSLAKFKFNKSSLIYLHEYIINKNQRSIKKKNIELQLTEKEVDLLTLFSLYRKPITKKFILSNVWKYSAESETHTVETHIHRLRKKFLNNFGDNNFIKNDTKGYYI